MTAPSATLVDVVRVSKRFGSLQAIDDVSFGVRRGRVVALLGENGAGKSTIMNVLAGLYRADSGHVAVDGVTLRQGSPSAAIAAGVGMVHQQFQLVETLSALENVSLAIDRGRPLLPSRPAPALRRLADQLGFAIPWDRPVWQIGLAQRQQLEIFRVLAAGARVLVLDEPTSVLSPVETLRLFDIVAGIARSGRSVVLISHKLPEIRLIADDLVVMRAGRVVHDGPNVYRDPASDLGALARLIVGDRLPAARTRAAGPRGPVVLRVDDLSVDDGLGRMLVHDVGFEIWGGELVALVGVAGNGQTELLDAIAGLRPAARGTVRAPGLPENRDFAYAPAQPMGVALAPGLSVAENAVLGRQRRPPFGAWLRRPLIEACCRAAMAVFGVGARPGDDVGRLSGGTMQRLVLGRELADDPALVVAAYPTRGLDVASAVEIRNALVARAAAGAAVLFASEELDESRSIATRLLVMQGGRIVATLDPLQASAEAIGRLMTGDDAITEDADAA